MSLLTSNNLSKEFGPEEIFSGVSIEIPHKARIALVGPNGAGKTTLLNILIGNEPSTEGSVTKARGTRIGFLPQRPELNGDHTLWDELLSAFNDLLRMEEDIQYLENQMSSSACTVPGALQKYGELQEQFEQQGGYTYESRMRMVLQGIGFKPEQYKMPLDKLSGGQKTRALLGRLLLQEPDLLVLDEPTNHLDIDAVEWLENFLNDYKGAVLVVSHDRYFMDAVANTIWELDFGELEVYRGNYSKYLLQRGERYERLQKEYESQQAFIAKEEEYIRRNIAGQNTKQAQGRRTRLERLKKNPERYGLVKRPHARQNLKLSINTNLRSGDRVLYTKKLQVGYADAAEPLFSVPDIVLMRGETAALIGPNGVGKSTFLKTILGQLAPLEGASQLGASVKIGYFAQAHELLDAKKTVLDELLTVKNMLLGEARDILAQYLFQGDDVFREVSTLSGGERGRLALAKLALDGANFLLLDEPTNHLDIPSQEVLQDVLDEFTGTILLVSHDRYLVDALATQIWSARPGAMKVFKGTYAEFVAARNLTPLPTSNGVKEKAQTNGAKTSAKKHGLNPFQLQKKVDEVEANIHQLEARLKEVTAEIETASAKGDSGKVSQLGVEYTQLEVDLHQAMATWETLME